MRCCALWDWIQPWLHDYNHLQSLSVVLTYVQVACAIIGSLGTLYNGIFFINLTIALFALVAIECNSQSLGCTYIILLFCAFILDVSWFIIFSHQIWFFLISFPCFFPFFSPHHPQDLTFLPRCRNISSPSYGPFFISSVRLTLIMQILAFCVRLSSSLLWIQIYRLDATPLRETNLDLRNSFVSPATPFITPCSYHDDTSTTRAIYNPLYYSSLFKQGQDGLNSYVVGSSASPAFLFNILLPVCFLIQIFLKP